MAIRSKSRFFYVVSFGMRSPLDGRSRGNDHGFGGGLFICQKFRV